MSNEAITWAWRQDVGSPVRKCILLHLCDSAHKETGYMSWYSITKISERCNCSKSTISANMKWLIENGFITLVRRGVKNGSTNCYRVHVGRVEVQKGPAETVPGAEQSMPDFGISAIPADEQSIPADEQSIPGAGCITQRNPKEPKENISSDSANADQSHKFKKLDWETEQKIIELYHKHLPELSRVMVSRWKGSSHSKQLHARWREDERFRTGEFWLDFFKTVRTNPWWLGEPNNKGESFEHCKLAWLVKRENFDKVLERGGFDQ